MRQASRGGNASRVSLLSKIGISGWERTLPATLPVPGRVKGRPEHLSMKKPQSGPCVLSSRADLLLFAINKVGRDGDSDREGWGL